MQSFAPAFFTVSRELCYAFLPGIVRGRRSVCRVEYPSFVGNSPVGTDDKYLRLAVSARDKPAVLDMLPVAVLVDSHYVIQLLLLLGHQTACALLIEQNCFAAFSIGIIQYHRLCRELPADTLIVRHSAPPFPL